MPTRSNARPLLLVLNVTDDVVDYNPVKVTAIDGRAVVPDIVELNSDGMLWCHQHCGGACDHLRSALTGLRQAMASLSSR